MEDSTTSPALKRCSKGDNCLNPLGCWLPATTEYFTIDRKRKDGLYTQCKVCKKQTTDAYVARHPERRKESVNKYDRAHRAQATERMRRWKENNPDKVQMANERHRDSNRIRSRKFREKHPEKSAATVRRYRERNPGYSRLAAHRYRARKRSARFEFTPPDWQRALEFFNWCCAYCGNQRDFWNTLEAEHFVPLKSPTCPGTVPKNMVPACRKCNAQKHYAEPVKWVNERFGKRRAREILKRIQAYFDSLD